MIQSVCRFIYHRILGWKEEVTVPDFKKCIICAAPHTSNWDLFLGKLFINAVGRKSGFLMKKEWFFFPLGPIFRAITPEGTRSANPDWKKGFYYIALGAELPIVLIGIDYQKKCITATKYLRPTGDIDKDMREIKLYFKDFKGKHPEKFVLGDL